jgi:hypothetical protein
LHDWQTARKNLRDGFIKGEKMNYKRYINPIAMGIGIGAAMSVALKDVSVGFAIGVAVAFAFAYNQRKDDSESK